MEITRTFAVAVLGVHRAVFIDLPGIRSRSPIFRSTLGCKCIFFNHGCDTHDRPDRTSITGNHDDNGNGDVYNESPGGGVNNSSDLADQFGDPRGGGELVVADFEEAGEGVSL